MKNGKTVHSNVVIYTCKNEKTRDLKRNLLLELYSVLDGGCSGQELDAQSHGKAPTHLPSAHHFLSSTKYPLPFPRETTSCLEFNS